MDRIDFHKSGNQGLRAGQLKKKSSQELTFANIWYGEKSQNLTCS